MGRKKINWPVRRALEAIETAMQDRQFEFIERLNILAATLRAHEEKRLQAEEQGNSSAIFSNWNLRNVTFDQGRTHYSGPYYDLRELCDNFSLPWPESGKIVLQMVSGLSASEMSEPPPADAWRAWRMAHRGFGHPRPDEIAEAEKLLGQHTPSGRKRNFSKGLTQDAIAHIMHVDVRTVRKWVSDCQHYAQVGTPNEIADLAELSGYELIGLVIKRLDEEKPEK